MFRSITDEPNSDPLPSDPGVEVDVVTIIEQKNDENSSLDHIEEPGTKFVGHTVTVALYLQGSTLCYSQSRQ